MNKVEQKKETTQRWRLKNKAYLKAYNKAYHKKNPHCRKEWRDAWKEANPEHWSKLKKSYRAKLKSDVIIKYGRICAGCGFFDMAGLSIDHINGDGSVERKLRAGYKFYEHLRREPKRDDLRVLCMTCQFMARAYGRDITTWPEQTHEQKKYQDDMGRMVFSWTADGPPINVNKVYGKKLTTA